MFTDSGNPRRLFPNRRTTSDMTKATSTRTTLLRYVVQVSYQLVPVRSEFHVNALSWDFRRKLAVHPYARIVRVVRLLMSYVWLRLKSGTCVSERSSPIYRHNILLSVRVHIVYRQCPFARVVCLCYLWSNSYKTSYRRWRSTGHLKTNTLAFTSALCIILKGPIVNHWITCRSKTTLVFAHKQTLTKRLNVVNAALI